MRGPWPTIARQPPGSQPHLASLRKKPRTAVRIVNAVDKSQHETNAAATARRRRGRRRRKEEPQLRPPQSVSAPANSASEQATPASAPQSTSESTFARVSFCYAVSLRSASGRNNYTSECLLRAAEYYVQLRE